MDNKATSRNPIGSLDNFLNLSVTTQKNARGSRPLFQRWGRIFLLAMVLLAALEGVLRKSVNLPAVFAAETSSTPMCWSLDIVLLIDQSYSMFSQIDPKTGEPMIPSDKENYRYQATKDILDKLIDNRLDICPLALHRIAILAFGQTTRSVLSSAEVLTTIDLPPTATEVERDAWSSNYFELIEKASQDKSQNSTDPQQAFSQADVLLTKAPTLTEPPEYGPRRQVIVLVTDGNPTGRFIGNRSITFGADGIPDYMCQLKADLNQATWAKRSIWIVAMNGSYGRLSPNNKYLDQAGCGKDSLGNNLSEIAEAHQGHLLKPLYNATALQQAINSLVADEFGQVGESIQCGDVFFVEPYLQQVKLTFFRPKATSPKVILAKLDDQNRPIYQISDGLEERLNPASLGDMVFNARLSSSRRNVEELVFDLPTPGAWRFDVQSLSHDDCQRNYQATKVKAVAEAILANPAPENFLAQEFEPPYYDPDGPIPFVVRLKSSAGTMLKPDPQYPLVVKAHLILPEDATFPADFVRIPDEFEMVYAEKRQEWTSEQVDPAKSVYAVAPVPGNYSLVITGTAPDGAGKPGYQAFVQRLGYQVKKLERFSFAVTTPAANAVVACNGIQDGQRVNRSFPISIQVSGPEHTQSNGYINTDLQQAFQASAVDAQGQQIGQPTFLAPQDNTGVFTGELLTGETNNPVCGELKVQVQFMGGFDNRLYTISDQKKIVELPITRRLFEGVRLNPSLPAENSSILLHPNFQSACPGGTGVQPATLEFGLEDLNGKGLTPEAVGTIANLYLVRLVNQDTGKWEDLTVAQVELADGMYLTASGGASLAKEGHYYFEITPQPSVFALGYLPATEVPLRINFSRQDKFFTHPNTCVATLSASGLLLAGLAGLIIYLLTGGPGGSLALTKTGDPNNVIGGPFKLSTARIFSMLANPTLKTFGIEKIKYGKALGTNRKAVTVEVFGASQECDFAFDLEAGEDNAMPLKDEEIVYYR